MIRAARPYNSPDYVLPITDQILVVATDHVVRDTIAEMFEQHGCSFEVAADYEAGIKCLLHNRTIGLVVLDCNNIDLETWWFIERIRASRPQIEIVASHDGDDPQALKEIGVSRCLPKYWETEDLCLALWKI